MDTKVKQFTENGKDLDAPGFYPGCWATWGFEVHAWRVHYVDEDFLHFSSDGFVIRTGTTVSSPGSHWVPIEDCSFVCHAGDAPGEHLEPPSPEKNSFVYSFEVVRPGRPADAEVSMDEGQKFDGDKPRMDLIPPEAIEALSHVLTFGANKYADRNWELGMDWGRVFAALMRHLWAWWKREDKDPETGMSHLWHALACIAFLVTFEQRKAGKDDRA